MTKLSGAGNSFLLTDLDLLEALHPSEKKMQELALKLCDPHFGVGADGFIFLKKLAEDEYQWFFYNADGSSAEMCGNATRCVGRYLKIQPNDKPIRLKTLAGDILIHSPKEQRYESRMTLTTDTEIKKISLDINKTTYEGLFLDSGVPHFCIQVDTDEFSDLNESLADAIQTHTLFQPNETNVTFWTEVKQNEIKAASFERGVREFTLACGTGAVAAAMAYIKTFSPDTAEKKIIVQMPGGRLKVRTEKNHVYLSGPAIKIATIKAKEAIQ